MLAKLKNTDFERAVNDVNSGLNVTITGLNIGEKSYIASQVKKPAIFVAPSVDEGEVAYNQFLSMNLKTTFVRFVDYDVFYGKYTFGEVDRELNIALFNLCMGKTDILVVNSKILNYRLPSPEIFLKHIISLSKNDTISPDSLKKRLSELGYTYQTVIEEKGQFSYRGDCVDIFPINSELPYRISFFDEDIEYIKTFNLENYATIEEVKHLDICPNSYLFLSNQDIDKIISKIQAEKDAYNLDANSFTRLNNMVENICLEISNKTISSKFLVPYLEGYNSNILSYLNCGTVIFDETKVICKNVEENLSSFNERYLMMLKSGELMKSHKNFLLSFEDCFKTSLNKLAYINLNNSNRIFETQRIYSFLCEPIINYNGKYDLLSQDLNAFLKRKFFVTIMTGSDINCVNTYKNLEKLVPAKIIKIDDNAEENLVNISPAGLYKSVNFTKQKTVIISINQIHSQKIAEKTIQNKKKSAFYLPKVGDYVVHSVFGIGICEGVERLKFGEHEKDYIILRYRDNDKYYLPTEKINELSSYVSSGVPPKLNKLGTDEFEKEKAKVKASVKKMAFSLINLYAERQILKGYRYEIDDILYKDFAKGFEYKETDDQLVAINDIEKDMTSGKVMDRLICGDVGFGKTEVAFRAIFIAVMNSKQVALLCPTTILSEQHYNACMTRMSPYMANVEVINRFKTPKQQKDILERVKKGEVNVLIGTSRLLSKDVEFKNLGLLVLDEEQKFGVEAKEKLKNMKKDLDVLTLSATPIPRTLHISMSGIRDISIIETPPENRLPVQTIVTEYSDTVIKDAILRELRRNGQVLIIYNSVETIYNFAGHIRLLVPEATVGIAHGQMDEKTLYSEIQALYNQQTNVLVSTTLIENGVDLPTANTLICINAQNLGLSELYQLKGRVGRSSLLAYAYFMYPENKVISEDATKRLNALSEYTTLGSGFKIAMRDLEIRGAGNILGKEQHGHIVKVGYDMYCKILKEATEELKGKNVYRPKDCKIIVDISAYIPNNFVPDNEARFRLYNTISNIDSVDELNKIKEKITDMYSSCPSEVENLAKIALIQNMASKIGIKQANINQNIMLWFYSSDDITSQNVTDAIKTLGVKAQYSLKGGPLITFENKNNINSKIDFVINFLTICNKSVN